MMTMREAAEAAQLRGELCRVFDYALPQDWVDEVYKLTGKYPPHMGFVWAYPDSGRGHVYGMPFALTDEGHELIAQLPESLR